MSVLLIFEVQPINGALFFNAKGLLFVLPLLPPVTVTSPFTTIYTSLKPHKSDLSTDVLNLICLFGLHLSLALPDWSWTSTIF